jgi:hypothetical protein
MIFIIIFPIFYTTQIGSDPFRMFSVIFRREHELSLILLNRDFVNITIEVIEAIEIIISFNQHRFLL